jgi:malonate-semialdehyde dehydrogenase (acetylating)/methylmalonate-semialdehyde dehydrogenase
MTEPTLAPTTVEEPLSLIGGEFVSADGRHIPVLDPATGQQITSVALGGPLSVDAAVTAARDALQAWATLPATRRARLLLRLAALLDERADELVVAISVDNGKTLTDARAEVARAIEHLEAAATAPALLSGYGAHNVGPGIDTSVLREPVGVCAIVQPFNFPVMTGLIYHSWALACGNTVVVKPSEQAPVAASAFAALLEEAGFPAGVFNLVHGDRVTVEALCDHPDVAAVSLVGSSATALAVYARASAAGKRVHCAGGARNFLVAMEDADPADVAPASAASAFGMAGQRCLSSSVIVAVGSAYEPLRDRLVQEASRLRVGSGFDPQTDISPMISRAAVESLGSAVEICEQEGAVVLVDGRDPPDTPGGFFAGATLLDGVSPNSPVIASEMFGPLLSILRARDLDEALALLNSCPFGNAASIFTRDGDSARRFALQADVGNIGVNVAVAAPSAQFGFGGRKRSFYGAVHSQGREAIEFYTDRKSLTLRW